MRYGGEAPTCAVAGFRMVNYYLQLFLPHPESQIVNIDEQFGSTAATAVNLMGVRRHHRIVAALFLHAPDSAQSPRLESGARNDSERGFHERQGRAHP